MITATAQRYEKARTTRFACRLKRSLTRLPGFRLERLCAGLAFVFATSLSGAAAGQATVGATVSLPSTNPGSSTTLGEMQDLCRAGAVPDYDNVQSLERVFGEVARGVGGQIIRAELKQRGFNNLCVWVYEVKTLSDAGKVTMAIFDASDMRLIGFSTPSSLDLGPVVRVPSTEGIRKSLQEPDGDGRADSDDGVAAASSDDGGYSDTDATTADAAADAVDSGQRGGTAGAKGGSAASDSSNDAAASGASSDGSSADSGTDASSGGNASASTDGSAGSSAASQ